MNTPRQLINSDGIVVWQWDGEAFGNTPPNANPSGLGNLTFNLRFPGQYYDAETNLNQNYFRDYDPSTGRYVESDLIGLRAGLNTFGYAKDNPVNRIDPKGLEDASVFSGWTINWPGGGYGMTSVVCKDKCGKLHKYTYKKICVGIALPGASANIGRVDGMTCSDPRSYEGGFWELSGGAGVGTSIDIGDADGNGNRITEFGGGVSTPGVGFLYCYYVLVSSN